MGKYNCLRRVRTEEDGGSYVVLDPGERELIIFQSISEHRIVSRNNLDARQRQMLTDELFSERSCNNDHSTTHRREVLAEFKDDNLGAS